MSVRKADTRRPFPPDFVSAETLAYRLDCSRSTIDDYVRRGWLPGPRAIGNLQRWRWSDVETWIAVRSALDELGEAAGANRDSEDPYVAGVKRAATTEA